MAKRNPASASTAPPAHATMADMELNESFLDIAMDDVPEMHVAQEGEYEVRIERARIGLSEKEGKPAEKYLMLYHEIPSDPTVKTFTNVLMLGNSEEGEKSRFEKLNRLRDACDAFGVSYAKGINVDDFAGKTAWATLGVKDDPTYGEQNTVRNYRAGR